MWKFGGIHRMRPLHLKDSALALLVLFCLLPGSLSPLAETLDPSSRRSGLTFSEIMYHPADRADGKRLEFIEIFNTEPMPKDLSGFRLNGDVDYTFPTNTTLGGLSFLVVAANPADVQSVYGLTGVVGPIGSGTNSFPNDAGTIRLRSKAGAVLLEVQYKDEAPWPVAADGAGHSLVLARPSLGEGDPRAWSASANIGGSPGQNEPVNNDPINAVLINEIFPASQTEAGFIELYNHGAQTVDLTGCVLTDDPATNKYVLPAGLSIAAGGYLLLSQENSGVALSASGGTIYFKAPNAARVLDAVRLKSLQPGISTGRFPDGSEQVYPLKSSTPGVANSAPRVGPVVINELMYHPISGNSDDQYVELFNVTGTNVNLSGWKISDAIDYSFSTGMVLQAHGYLVVGKNVGRLLTNYPALNTNNTVGNFSGKLSGNSERVALTMPITALTTNKSGVVKTSTIQVAVDEVTYGSGGRWPQWADGGGSSLELIDPRSNHRLAASWGDSDETEKAPWTIVEHTGVLDNGTGTANELQMFLQEAGECLVDDVEVLDSNSANLISNSTFEADSTGWVAEGTQDQSSVENREGYASTQSFHVRAVGRGDTGANRIRSALTANLASGTTATIRAKVRWLKGRPEFLLRLRGNYLEAIGNLTVPKNLGTPGERNSRAANNAGPAIYDVSHSPVLPAANQAATVTARVDDPDGLSSLKVNWRLDPAATYNSVSMVDDGTGGDVIAGDGIYTGRIPGQVSGALVAFYIEATDNFPTGANSSFPNDAPSRECLIRFGETQPAGTLGTYRLWITQANFNAWANRSKLNNTPVDVTFIYNNQRIIYNMGALYAGSPYISPGYSTPSGNLCGYTGSFPNDDRFLGTTDFVLDWPGRDTTATEEQISFWIADQIGLPNSYRRYIHLQVNGVNEQSRGSVYEDVQQPGSDMIKEWSSDDTDGNFYKIERWFEFSDTVSLLSDPEPRLENYTTTGGVKKLARYRWNWLPRAVKGSVSDYTNLFALVDAVNAPAYEPYTSATETLANMEEMMGIFAVERIVNNFDSWGHEIGKNMYAYKPEKGRWITFMFDIDWVMLASAGHNNYSPTSPLFTPVEDPTVARMYSHPPFRRAYFRNIKKAVEGPLMAANVNPVLDAKYSALNANGVTRSAGGTLTAPAAVKTWISQRRDYLITQLATVAANFAITSNNGADFSSSSNLVTLTGTAPIEVTTLRINGVERPVQWTTVTNWAVNVVLVPQLNSLTVEALNEAGEVISSGTATINVTFNGTVDAPEGKLVLNEIMSNPKLAGGGYVELYNSSGSSFDLTGWRLDGLDYNFAPGTVIMPGDYMLLAKDLGNFMSLYGNGIPVTGEFNGELKPQGETLELLRPNNVTTNLLIVDQVNYAATPPWPAIPAGAGASLQLIDPRVDNSRVANWAAVLTTTSNSPPQKVVSITDSWKYYQNGDPGSQWNAAGFDDTSWPGGAGLLYVETAALPAPKRTALTLGQSAYYFRTHFQFNSDPAGKSLEISPVVDDGAVFYLNGQEVYRLGMTAGAVDFGSFASRLVGDAAYEGPFVVPATGLKSGDNLLAVEVHQNNLGSSDIVFGTDLAISTTAVNKAFTPGSANSVRQSLPRFPTVWLNEVQPMNVSGAVDNFGQHEPWVELYNSGTASVTLDGWYLTDTMSNLTKWAFPSGISIPAKSFLTVWLDGESAQSTPSALHANFRIPQSSGAIALVWPLQGQPTVLDYLNYSVVPADRSYGVTVNGDPTHYGIFFSPTPGAGNNASAPPLPLFINEWMASNQQFMQDPADDSYNDWFEIYNPNDLAVDLTGYSLNQTVLEGFTRWPIPAGTQIAPHGFLLVWADSDTSQNSPESPDLHTNFKLNKAGDTIAIFAPSGAVVDVVNFGVQTNDVSQGRWPDGSANIVYLERPTPRASNVIASGAPVEFSSIAVNGSGQLMIGWSSENGLTYILQYKNNLEDPQWITLGEVTATGQQTIVPDNNAGAPHRFYRLQLK